MSGLSQKQIRALRRKLDRCNVQSRDIDGRSLDYIEGWFAIAEANAIFGFDGWDREMAHFERLYEGTRNDATSCSYLARVRIRVRVAETVILREGTGTGNATASNAGDAHERALKAAETDATKRALATFGNRFGLGLYDKEQHGVTPKKAPSPPGAMTIHDPQGAPFASNLSPEGFCIGLRQMIEKSEHVSELEGLQGSNTDQMSRLRACAPDLKTTKNVHYADILERLFNTRREHLAASLAANGSDPVVPKRCSPEPVSGKREVLPQPVPSPPLKPSRIAAGPRIDKNLLPIGTERRLRDKAHLQFVASHSCLVCGQHPSQAHHLTFAQRRWLSMKVSDEFTVPLCVIHHDELHRTGPERAWWTRQGLDPRAIAAKLWMKSRTLSLPQPIQMDEVVSQRTHAPETPLAPSP